MKSLLTGCLALTYVSGAALRAESDTDHLRYLIPPGNFAAPTPEDRSAMTEAACDGKVAGGACDTCPTSDAPGGGFTLRKVILGHFLKPDSEDAIATAFGCEQMHGSLAWGFLFTKREGAWQALDTVIGLDLDHCRGMRFSDGRQLMLCEDYGMESWILMHSVTALFARREGTAFQKLLTAADTTRLCSEQTRVQKAQIDRMTFRELNDGQEEIAITASFGTLPDSKRRQQLCEEAETNTPGVRRLEPAARKSYRITYLFDGREFKLTKDSEAAAKLFAWEN